MNAYPDVISGNLPITIGWGSTRDFDGSPFKMGRRITQEYADRLLEFDLEKRFLSLLQRIPYWSRMNDEMRGSLLSFTYNLGTNFYNSFEFNTITRVLKNKEWSKVPDALILYRNPGSNVEKGLLRRRTAESKLWLEGLKKLNE